MPAAVDTAEKKLASQVHSLLFDQFFELILFVFFDAVFAKLCFCCRNSRVTLCHRLRVSFGCTLWFELLLPAAVSTFTTLYFQRRVLSA